MLASGMPTPPPWILEAFGCKPGTTLPWMRNTRAVQDERFMVSDVYHHPDLSSLVRGAPFKKLLRERKLVVMALCEIAGMTLGEIRQSLTASLAGEDMAQTLRIPVGEPLLVVDRVFISDTQRVILSAAAQHEMGLARVPKTLPAAARNVLAHLLHLAEQGLARPDGPAGATAGWCRG